MYVRQILLSIYVLLNQPDLDYPLAPEVAEMYRNDYEKYWKTAEEYTKKYAT